MSTDTKWTIGTVVGTGLAIVTALLTIAGLLFAQFGSVNTRIADLRNELRAFRTEVNDRMEGFDTRLRDVEIAFGKVDQRLLIIKRFVLPTPDEPTE